MDNVNQQKTSEELGVVIPLVAEHLEVGRRETEIGRVRITKTVREREEIVDEALLRQNVFVERVAINRVIDGEAPAMRYEGDTMILPVLEEVLVVEKRLLLKEEIHIRQQKQTVQERQQIALHSEEVAVERVPTVLE